MPCLLRDSENEELSEYYYFIIGGRFCHVSADNWFIGLVEVPVLAC